MPDNQPAAVCIINYNTRECLRLCLQSVLAQAPGEVIVFDNHSSDGSAEMVEQAFSSVTLIRSLVNTGYGPAANRAIAQCRVSTIFLLNSDTVLQPGFLAELGAYLRDHAEVGIAGAQVLNLDGTPQTSVFYFPTPGHIFLYLTKLYRWVRHIPFLKKRSFQASSTEASSTEASSTQAARVVPWVLGAALAIRREAFEQVGGFDEDFFLYFEETDLCYRLAEHGWQTHFAPVASVIHVGGASSGQQRVASKLQYFASLAQFYRKHYSPFQLTALMLMVRWIALLNLVGTAVRLSISLDPGRQATLSEDFQAWKRLALGQWSRQPSFNQRVRLDRYGR